MKLLLNFTRSSLFRIIERFIGIFYILFPIYTILWVNLVDSYSILTGINLLHIKGYMLLIIILSAFVFFLSPNRSIFSVLRIFFGALFLSIIPFFLGGNRGKSYIDYSKDIAAVYVGQKISRLADTTIFGVFPYLSENYLLSTKFTIEVPEGLKVPDLPKYVDIYAIAQPSNSIVVLCSEDRYPVIYKSDRFGLRNPDTVWDTIEGKKTVVVLGDSFAFGDCVRDGDTFVDAVRYNIGDGFRIINLAGRNDNILSAMVKFVEFSKVVNPNIVLLIFSNYGFYELANVWANYIVRLYATKENFSQAITIPDIKSLVDREIKKKLENETKGLIDKFVGPARKKKKKWTERIAEKYEDIFNSSLIAKVFQRKSMFGDENLILSKIAIDKMMEVGKNSAFVFVYVEFPGEKSLYDKIQGLLKNRGIRLFRLKVRGDLEELYPGRLYVSKGGHEIVAEDILEILRSKLGESNHIFSGD